MSKHAIHHQANAPNWLIILSALFAVLFGIASYFVFRTGDAILLALVTLAIALLLAVSAFLIITKRGKKGKLLMEFDENGIVYYQAKTPVEIPWSEFNLAVSNVSDFSRLALKVLVFIPLDVDDFTAKYRDKFTKARMMDTGFIGSPVTLYLQATDLATDDALLQAFEDEINRQLQIQTESA